MAARNDRNAAAERESPDHAAASSQSVSKIRDEDFREYYCNISQVRLTPFDLTMLFGRFGEAAGRPVQIESAAVTMSPVQFKIFASSLVQMVEAFEKTFGTINMPKIGMQPSLSVDGIAGLIDSAMQKAVGDQSQQTSKAKKST